MALIDKLTALGDAIRNKTGKTKKLTLDQMVEEINTLRQAPMYTVRFLNGDVVLQTSQVREGETPVFVGENPTPEPDFAFVGWLPEIAPVIGDVDYVAQFKSTKSVARGIIDGTVVEVESTGATKVGESALAYCSQLRSATFSNATSIGESAFAGCGSLVEVYIPNATRLETYSFEFCKQLTNISLPSCTYIGTYAFRGNESLTSVSLPSTPPYLSNVNAFRNINANCVFHIPTGSLSAYQNATNWSTLTGQYTFTEDA